MKSCLYCAKPLSPRNQKYCNNQCQREQDYESYITEWKAGKQSGRRGIEAKNVSGHVIRYIRRKYGNSCSICGWDKLNPTTKKVPLEIDHIDGNSDNNTEDNLRVICPNCHSLTSSFRNLNTGKGRKWRRDKYNRSTK